MLNLRVEGMPDRSRVAAGYVGVAAMRMARPDNPPTYVVVTAPDKTYCQAAGSRGRFIAESREWFGEGFTHWRAGRLGVEDDTPTTIYYRQQCVDGKHRPLECPLSAIESDVLQLTDVQAILTYFASHRERHPGYRWREITEKFVKREESPPDDEEILEIRPGGEE